MAERIVHISDLHFGDTERAETPMLAEAIASLKPTLIVCSGDLTAQGRLSEFTSAFAFLSRLPWTQVVVPGNHDVPYGNLWKRLVAPFGRFISTRGGVLEDFRSKTCRVVAVETTKAVQLRLDWSLGVVDDTMLARADRELRAADAAMLRVLVTHHPLWPSPLDPRRSRTKGGPRALARMAAAGAELHLHGHLHRASAEILELPGGRVLVVGAGSALSDRVRDAAASFNVIDWDAATVTVTAMNLGPAGYIAASPQRFARGSGGPVPLPADTDVPVPAPVADIPATPPATSVPGRGMETVAADAGARLP